MIKLYYVRGINRTDTPYFNTLVEQENYFNEKLISSIDAIYPPHYQNTIQFSNEDLDFNTQCNYISLDFNGKTYYYFIDDMEYLAEDLIRITITMDTFQTYMFDIDYHNARLQRETIRRWNSDGTINRNYIRENYGSNLFQLDTYKEIEKNNGLDELVFYVGMRPPIDNFIYSEGIVTTTQYKDKSISNFLICEFMFFPKDFLEDYFSPSGNKRVTFNLYNDTGVTPYKTYSLSEAYNTFVNEVIEGADTYQAFLIKDLNIKDISVNKVINTDEQGEYITYDIRFLGKFDFKYDDNFKGLIQLFYYEEDDTPINVKLPFIKNDYLGNAFQVKYIPQLIDENYINFRYGERLETTTFPLSKLETRDLYLYKYIDIFSNSRSYWCSNSNDGKDKYLTIINVDTKEYLTLKQVAWQDYLANNIGTLTIGTALSSVSSFMPIVSGSFSLYKGANILQNVKRRQYAGRLTKGMVRGYEAQIQGINDISSSVSDLGNGLGSVLNNAFKPDKVKQGNNCTTDYITNGLQEIYFIEYVTNIQGVASVYESIGYSVDEYIYGSPIRNNRQIYNYLECSEIDLEITMLCSDSIISDIENRFLQGLRLWNITTMNSLDLQLGDVCVYDNLEVEEVTNE